MKPKSTSFQIVAGGGWRGTRVDRVKVKAWVVLIIAIILAVVSISSIGTNFVYVAVPAGVSFITLILLFVWETPVEIESFTGRIKRDPSELYGVWRHDKTARSKDDANES